MLIDKGKYNIKAVSTMLGIQPGTLRAWERRYQVIAPKRTASGHRLYTDEQVEILRKLVAKVNEGLTIRQAVALVIEESKDPIPSFTKGDEVAKKLDELLQSFILFDEQRAHASLSYLFSVYTVETVVTDVLPSLLCHIYLWRIQKKMTSAHEQFARSFLRSKLGAIVLNIPIVSQCPKAVSILGPNETDELILLIFTAFLRLKGIHAIYIGGDVSESDFLAMLNDAKPTFLFFSCMNFDHIEKMNELVSKLRDQVPDITIGLIGEAAASHPFYVGKVKEQWEKWLAQRIDEQK